MKKIIVLLLVAMICFNVFGAVIILDDGSVFEGKIERGKEDIFYLYLYSAEDKKLHRIPRTRIKEIIYSEQMITTYEQPNLKLLPVSVIAFLLAYDNLYEIKDLNDRIDTLSGKQKRDAKEERTRKLVLGVTFLMTGAINTLIAFERVEIQVDMDSFGVGYKF